MRPWYFGMKAHIGVDSQSRLTHSVRVILAGVHDSQVVGEVLHGDERRVYGDSAYTDQKACQSNRIKSRIRARVEHLFAVMKHQFGY